MLEDEVAIVGGRDQEDELTSAGKVVMGRVTTYIYVRVCDPQRTGLTQKKPKLNTNRIVMLECIFYPIFLTGTTFIRRCFAIGTLNPEAGATK
jgi:hypothetical protein